jgi:gliding motility-associated-like protein
MAAVSARASHIFGVDLSYTNVGGNVYTVTLAVYGDCSGSAFYNLSTSSPTIDVYNGSTYVSSMTLSVQPPTNGVEVSPVCPSQLGNTTCTNITSSLPGIKKFIYSANVTLPSASTVWRFVFSGNMGGSSLAGRSNAITNINIPTSGSSIYLVDTLNNTSGGNSSPQYNTIPTPYFCINTPANYNPAAVDPNGDALSFDLVPAIDASTGVSVNYVWPYNATAPLGVVTGTFSFTAANGQLSFTPNIAQRADVVYNVRETVGGVLRGTSQREMTIVVLSPCTNNPPSGSMSGASGGTLSGGTQINICNNVGVFTFHINPTDADGDTITMTASGLPTGATFNIVNNSTAAPQGTFSWNTTGVTPGTYTFYINYQDRGCPIASRQSVAYTINVLPAPSLAFSFISAATCTRKALFTVTPGTVSGPWTINILQGATTVQTFTGITSTLTDSLNPGTYTIRTYNSVSCYKDTTVTFAAPPLPSGIITITTPLCTGDANGSISVTGTAGTTPYTYALGAGSYGSSGSFTGLAAGVYTLHIRDANSCTKDTSVTVPGASPTLLSVFVRRPTCNGYANGRVIIIGYNSVAPYTYAMGSGTYSATDTFDNLTAGTYTFHVKNANGCIKDTTLTFVDSQYLHGSISATAIACYGGTSTVTVAGIGGFGTPYSYAYNTGAFGPFGTFTLTQGTYTFHITDPQACFFDTTITITQPTPVSITTTPTAATCNGTATGSVAIAATGGTPGYTYAVDAGAYSSSATVTSLLAGTHTVSVKDANNCVYTATVTVTQPTAISADSVSKQLPLCNGVADGILRIYASGGTPGYSYALNTGTYGSSNIFTALAAGTYTLHIKDANGCIKDTTVTLVNPLSVIPGATVTPSQCQNLANGAVTLSGTGGTPAYSYAQGAGAYGSSPTFSPLAAGTYTFHIRDVNGCIADTTLIITNLVHIMASFAVTPPLCFGDANGIVTVTGTTGTSPYTYAFGTGSYSTANTFTAIAAGANTFHIRDAVGCIGDTTITVTQPAPVTIAVTTTQPSCYSYTNGSATAVGSGGTAPYTYAINGGTFATSATFTSLAAGTYTVSVQDAHNCTTSTIITIGQPSPLVITALGLTNISCNGGADGMVSVTASGGTPAYQYASGSGAYQVSNTLTGFTAGTYVIHVKDNQGCTTDSSITLTQPATLGITSVTVTNPTCEGFADGAVTIIANGGTTPYQYSTDNLTFSGSASFGSLTEGAYTLFVKDANGCSADTIVTLIGYPHINYDSFTITSAGCAGQSNGGIIIYGSGGNPPLTYSLSGMAPSTAPNVFTALLAGSYTATITDAKNCTKDSLVNVPQPDSVKVTTTITPNSCLGLETQGAVVANVTGGTPPYSYLWSLNADTAAYISNLPNGDYAVYVKDANNCGDSATATVTYNNCCTPFLPNAFSPNGDGHNDFYRMVYKGDIELIEFSVYNRFGERVFLTKQINDGWNGTYKDIPCDIGTYYYYIKLYCGNRRDKILEFKGDVTLVK